MIGEEDYKITPCGTLGCRVSVSDYRFRGEFDTVEEALAWIRQDMQASNYWPDVWLISDHGNATLIDLDGNIIPVPEEPEEEGW